MSKDKVVSVEMTEDQKNKVVDMFAKEKAVVEKKFVKVDLLHSHKVNGHRYGPGVVQVPEELQGHLEVGDQKATVARLKENISTNTQLEILSRGISRIVKRTVG
jgi:hypothetical protein